MSANGRRIQEKLARAGQRFGLQLLPEPLPDPAGFPAAEAHVSRVPVAQLRGEITPRAATTKQMQHGFEELPIRQLPGCASGRMFGRRNGGRELLPNVVGNDFAHRMLEHPKFQSPQTQIVHIIIREQSLVIEESKVTGYLLNLGHEEGRSKAQYFVNRGFEVEKWEEFAAALGVHGRTQPVTETETTRHGQKYVVECQIVTPDGKNPCILSVWIREGTKPLRLVTAHPNS